MRLAEQLHEFWNSADRPPDVFVFLQQHDDAELTELVAAVVTDQEHRWKTDQPLQVEDYLARLPRLSSDPDCKLQLAVGEFRARQLSSSAPSVQEFATRFPDISDTLRSRLSASENASEDPGAGGMTSMETYVPEGSNDEQMLGRYRLQRVLGEGAYGRVYLGFDDELQRQVAIKVPTEERFRKPEDAEQYLAEARTVASLDHPHIVPVHDTGRTDDGSIYVVSKFIDGCTLRDRIRDDRPAPEPAAELIATVARALHHAHEKRLVHRDVKPGNILLEENTGNPYVADFGLAIREEDSLRHSHIAGTPAYMSPEQARGEGHRLDGRSDIFSLGIILYELLTGSKPFRGSSASEYLHKITTEEPRPPREVDTSIPVELNRICLKALSKRASDRYATANEMAYDLKHWNDATSEQMQPDARIVPKGLRSFDADDADFFLELLPGPRNRHGLPESIQFWKTRLKETDPDQTFAVGLIYGPSGCGKSSLVKAGLLPRLSRDVTALYIEATPDDTEMRILRGLRKLRPDLSQDADLVDTFTQLRLSKGNKVVVILDQFEQWLHAHRAEQDTQLVEALRQCDGRALQAVVMIRDDFWMAASRFMSDVEVEIVQGANVAAVDLFTLKHAEKVLRAFGLANGDIDDSLSQNNGTFLQQSVSGLAQDGKVISVRLALFAEMVKGKPWTPQTLQEVGGTEGIGVNFLEETFSARTANPKHRLHQDAARQVLQALLPEVGSDIKGHMRSHAELLDISGYRDRPRDFAELLRILDGELRLITPTDPEGFQTQSGSQPDSKYYQLTHDYLVPSLREWLTRKQQETLKGRAELKLAERSALWNAKPESRHLPSLLEWARIRTLTEKNKWAEPQRAMMLSAGRTHGVRAAVAATVLVALFAIGLVVRTSVVRQQELTRVEGLVGRLVSAEPNQIPGIVEELNANPDVAASLLTPLTSQEAEAETTDERRAQLHARLAMVSRDPSLVEPLKEQLLSGGVSYVLPVRQLLRPSADTLTEELRQLLRTDTEKPQRRFRAALALADYVPPSQADSWTEQDVQFVAKQLVSSNAEYQPVLREALRPIREKLTGDLERIFVDPGATDAERLSAANAFADYAADDIDKLTDLLTVATTEQYDVLFPLVAGSPSPTTVTQLSEVAAELPAVDLGAVERVPFGQRRANAAVTLLRLGERENVLPVFEMSDDPEALTQFIFRCRSRNVDVTALLDCLQLVSESPRDRHPEYARYALLLGLGEFALDEIPDARQEALLTQLTGWYAQDPSSSVHGAAGWLLRHWGRTDIALQIDQTPVSYAADREWFTLAITVTPTPPPEEAAEEESSENASETEAEASESRSEDDAEETESQEAATDDTEESAPAAEPLPAQTFYYTFIVFPDGAYRIGSVEDEPERDKNTETRHSVKLTRPFAVLDREITFAELIAFAPKYAGFMQQFDATPADAGFAPDWYDSVGFCRWLGEQSGLPEGAQAYASPENLDAEAYPREPNPEANWAPRNWPVVLDRPGFRLPTESEWEVASRSGVRTSYGFGSDDSLLEHFGWFVDNSGKQVHPPKELRPSVRGLFDIHGNLFEWTHDWYGGDYDAGSVTDPLRSEGGSNRVYRGGSWVGGAAYCRSAYRSTTGPSRRTTNNGFRLVLSPSGVSSTAEQEQEAEPSGGGTEGATAEPRPEMPQRDGGAVLAW